MPSAANTDSPSNFRLLSWMFQFIQPVKGRVFLACLFLVLWITADVLVVRQTAVTVNELQRLISDGTSASGFLDWISGGDPWAQAIRRQVLWLGGLTVLLVLLGFLREVARGEMSMNMVYHIRESVYDRIQKAGFGFHDAYASGELISRSLTDLQNVREFIQSAVLLNLEIFLIVTGYVALLMTRSPWVAVLALLPLPFWTWQVLAFSRRIEPALRAALEAGDKNVALITENLSGVQVVKAFGAERLEIEKYNQHCEAFMERVLARIRMFANFTPLLRATAAASHLTLFLVASLLIAQGKLQAGDLLMLGSAMGAILARLQQVSVLNDLYQNAVVSSRRLFELLSAEPTISEAPGARPLPPGRGAVTFEGVTFGYDPQQPVVKNLSFSVQPGSVVALVGPTGAGKSTLVYLLARFYDPQAGRILIDGMDIRKASMESLRREIALVFQENYLFGEAVAANIAYGRPDLEASEIEAAGRTAQVHDFITSLPSGYQTILGDRGTTVSGGQRQRLAIARAVACDPRILILDDATASLDPETEALLEQSTRRALQGKTIFVIAHRVSTVERADVVLVLEQGRLTQMGTHAELMRIDGHYREIASIQLHGSASHDAVPNSSSESEGMVR